MAPVQKRFRIEQSLVGPAVEGPAAAAAPVTDPRLSEILATVQELKRFLDPSQKLATDVIDAYRSEIAQVYQLRAELDTMKEAISSTKREIASLYRSDNEGKGMRRVAGELDAVVGATEEATTSILAGLEDIENHAQMLRATGGDTGGNDHVGQILERIVSMYEACNFQDLTGQRIGKIVNVLKFVEERLDKMIGVWGGLDAFKELVDADAGAPAADDEKSLLNGPKLDDDQGHVDQTDIDALFD
ncbi:protein phosphatase CheZ [Salinarimonas soli]|uniref:Chemotaxis protein n=1 Tax=Salinarimonas soli TaxID=1638099 RepID=A0A5B2W018_9HYPH|nr:protein phosphatase CheZ [Salinarimonas soli]KAA2244308.1 chemotaxis protein [Salinarimonas soli]